MHARAQFEGRLYGLWHTRTRITRFIHAHTGYGINVHSNTIVYSQHISHQHRSHSREHAPKLRDRERERFSICKAKKGARKDASKHAYRQPLVIRAEDDFSVSHIARSTCNIAVTPPQTDSPRMMSDLNRTRKTALNSGKFSAEFHPNRRWICLFNAINSANHQPLLCHKYNNDTPSLVVFPSTRIIVYLYVWVDIANTSR